MMEKTYLVYRISRAIEGMVITELVDELDNIKDCNTYLEEDAYRVVSAWRKSNQ